MQAVILNAGIGTRMGELTRNKTKAMLPLRNGEAIFARQLRILRDCGIKKVIVVTGPFAAEFQKIGAQPCFQEMRITFVDNARYKKTDNGYSLLITKEHVKEDVLILYGDTVFNESLIRDLIESATPCLGVLNKSLTPPQPNLLARLDMERIVEIAPGLDEVGCFALPPVFKLNYPAYALWLEQISQHVQNGEINITAAQALNTILHKFELKKFSCDEYFIDDIDTPKQYKSIAANLRKRDFDDQDIILERGGILRIGEILKKHRVHKPMLVCDKAYDKLPVKKVLDYLKIKTIKFDKFTPDLEYADVSKGVELFKREHCDFLISVGDGAAIEMAKCIKLFSVLNPAKNYLSQKLKYSPVKHLAIPSAAGTGTESTRFAAITGNGEKKTIAHDCIVPECVLLDPNLLMGLSLLEKKYALYDAISHCIDAMWSSKGTSESSEIAGKALRLLLRNMNKYFNGEPAAADTVFQAANMAGKAINITKTSVIHALGDQLAKELKISHGHAVSLCMPYVWERMEYEANRVIEVNNQIYDILNNSKPVVKKKNILLNSTKKQGIWKQKIKGIKKDPVKTMMPLVDKTQMRSSFLTWADCDIRWVYKQILSNLK